MKLTKDEYDELCKTLAIKLATDYDVFAKLGFSNIGDLVNWLEKYKDD